MYSSIFFYHKYLISLPNSPNDASNTNIRCNSWISHDFMVFSLLNGIYFLNCKGNFIKVIAESIPKAVKKLYSVDKRQQHC